MSAGLRPFQSRPSYRRPTHRLIFYVVTFVVLLACYGRLRDPGTWRWINQLDPLDTQIAEADDPTAEAGDVLNSRDVKSPAKDGKGANPLAQDDPLKKPVDVKSTKPAAKVSEKPSAPVAKPVRDGERIEKSEMVNPLALAQTDECATVNELLLADVQDEIDAGTKPRMLSDLELRSRQARAVPAIYQMLCVAATRPAERLAAESRKDVFFNNLWSDPDTYRGKLIRMNGILRQLKIAREGVGLKNPYGIATVYEAAILTEEERAPVLVLFTQLPPGVQPSMNLKENVTVDGFFVKLRAYETQDKRWWAAPLLAAASLQVHTIDTSELTMQAAWLALGFALVIGAAAGAFWWRSKLDERWAARLVGTESAARPPIDPFAPLAGAGQSDDPTTGSDVSFPAHDENTRRSVELTNDE